MASKRGIRRSQCTSKRAYDTRLEAAFVLARMVRQKPVQERLRTYLCPYCRKWHLGHFS